MNRIQLTGNIVTENTAFFGLLETRGDKILSISRQGLCQPDANWILPGFIDVHVHGLGEYTAVDGAGACGMATFGPSTGLTGFLPTLASVTADAYCKLLSDVAECSTQLQPGMSRILGTHLEGPFIEVSHKGGMTSENLLLPEIKYAELFLKASKGTLRLITISPELPGATAVISYLRQAGVTCSAGHTGCSKTDFENAISAGLSQVCHLFDTFDGRLEDCGVSKPCLADIALIDDRVNLELISDGIHVPPELIVLARKAAGARRLIAITDGLTGAGLPEAIYSMADGRKYTINPDDVGRLVEHPQDIVGSCLTMNRAFSNLVSRFGFTPVEAAWMTSTNPARSIGLDGILGKLQPGYLADIAVLKPDQRQVSQTIIAGEIAYAC